MATGTEPSGNSIDLEGVDFVSNEEELKNILGVEDEDGSGKGKDKTPSSKSTPSSKGKEKEEEEEEQEEDELTKILNEQQGKKGKKSAPKEEEEEEEEEEEINNKKKKKKGEDDGINIGDEDEDEDEDEEPESVLHYINKAHKLGLNLENLPEEFTKKDEAEAVSRVIARVVSNANAHLNKYKAIQNLLQDEEVRLVLEAKRNGKTLKDIAGQYVTTVGGMSDEAVVTQDLKKKFTWATDQEITDMVQDHVKKGTLQKMANSAREEAKKNETLTTQQETEKQKRRREEEEEAYQESVEEYAKYVTKVSKVHGVPISQEMKREAFAYSTVRDKDGMSQLDHALQSDEGMLLATLGIIHMQKLIKASATKSSNKSKKDVFDLLDDSPENLQSSSKRKSKGGEVDVAILANKF